MCESPHVIIVFFRVIFVRVSFPLSKKASLLMVVHLFPNNKSLTFRELFASYLVLSTIGVYHQHQTCGASAPHVRSTNTSTKVSLKTSKMNGILSQFLCFIRFKNKHSRLIRKP